MASRAWSSSASSSLSRGSRKNMKLKTFQRKGGGGSGKKKTAKRVKHRTMTQKLARKKAGEERFRNVKVGIRSAPSRTRSSVPRPDPKSRPRVCTLERPGASSSRNKRHRPTTFYASPTSPRVDEAKRRLKVAEHRKLKVAEHRKPTDILANADTVSEDSSIEQPGPSPVRQIKSRFSFKSFGSNYSNFDTITAMRTKLSNAGSRIDNGGSDSYDNSSLRERYSRPEPVLSPTELRTPKPKALPPLSSSKLQRQPSTGSRQRARQRAMFDAMSGDEESRMSRESKVSRNSKASWDTKATERHFFADAQIPELSEDESASSNFDTVYTEQSAMEDGRLPPTGLPLPLNHRRQVSLDAKIVLSPSTEGKQTSGGRCRCE